MMPSLAIEYSILGSGTSAPRRDDVSPHRAPTAIIYLAQGAPLKSNTFGSVPFSGSNSKGHIRVRTVETPKYATKQIAVIKKTFNVRR